LAAKLQYFIVTLHATLRNNIFTICRLLTNIFFEQRRKLPETISQKKFSKIIKTGKLNSKVFLTNLIIFSRTVENAGSLC